MNRQQLTEALIDYNLRDVTPVAVPHLNPIIAAARLVERLLPGECDRALGKNCPFCFNTGRVWDEGIVEAVANVLDAWAPDLNDYAVEQFTNELLSALVELLTEKVET